MTDFPQVIKVADMPEFLKKYKLRAVRFRWERGAFVMVVTDIAPEKGEKGGSDQR